MKEQFDEYFWFKFRVNIDPNLGTCNAGFRPIRLIVAIPVLDMSGYATKWFWSGRSQPVHER